MDNNDNKLMMYTVAIVAIVAVVALTVMVVFGSGTTTPVERPASEAVVAVGQNSAGAAAAVPDQPSKALAPQCLDSDASKQYYGIAAPDPVEYGIYGSVYFHHLTLDNRFVTEYFYDSCMGKYALGYYSTRMCTGSNCYLKEYFCDQAMDTRAAYVLVECASCQYGACLQLKGNK